MAIVNASLAFTLENFDLRRLLARDMSFLYQSNDSVPGATYQQFVSYTFPSLTERMRFGGDLLGYANTTLNAGDIRGVYKQVLDARGDWTLAWLIKVDQNHGPGLPLHPQGYTALGFEWAMEHAGTAYEFNNLWPNIFRGPDYFELSRQADTARGFGGDDWMVGGAGSDSLRGDAGRDTLRGDAGNDTLDGGQGDDTMMGGAGHDRYKVDTQGDQVWEDANAGVDTVVSSVSYSIGTAQVENLELTGSAASGTGNGLNNRITGNRFANVLDGGLGADVLVGGLGNDTYVVDNRLDRVVDTDANGDAGGIDTVQSRITFSIADLRDIENLVITGTANVNATGNSRNNRITGNDGDNRIVGAAGADTMNGNGGDDVYVVDSADDVISERATAGHAGGGTDTVQARFSFDLTFLTGVENLVLTGSAAADGTGSHLANDIRGNAAANVLDGGSGADTLWGGEGDDTYYVDDAGDVVNESSDTVRGGYDVVHSSVSFSLYLGATQYIEKVVLTGAADIDVSGNQTTADHLVGNSGRNTLDGGDFGTGTVDRLEGGAGDDTYIVSTNDIVSETVAGTALDAGGHDVVRVTGSFTLPDFVEQAVALAWNASVTGNGLDNHMAVLEVAAGTEQFGATLDGAGGNDMIYGAGVSDWLRGGAGDDLLSGLGGVDDLDGGTGRDWLQGGDGDDILAGGDDADLLDGQADGDDMDGGVGSDELFGGAGDDTVHGGLGSDQLTGGSGRDLFTFSEVGHSAPANPDTILDFERGVDKIWFGWVFPTSSSTEPYPADLSGANYIAFSNELLVVDLNGDKVVDFALRLPGVTALSDSDFGWM